MTRPPLPPGPYEQGPRIVPADGIAEDDIDQDALRVLSRLQRSGFEAYLVGGCVRDLLLGRQPKDFDIATAAHPRQIKRLFRNGRIIGRRFRLVHVVYQDNIIETSTFRSQPPEQEEEGEDLLITEDNVFGTAEEDARRRDFTVNGLFLDPARRVVIDYVEGLHDLERRVLRTIGDPQVRMAEDPVRVLRAIKFATRLGFRIDDDTWTAMGEHACELVRSAPPRVLEELLRLMRSGTCLGAFRMLRACGALRVLLPQIDEHLGARDDPDPAAHDRADSYWRLLEALDADVHEGRDHPTSVLLAVLFLRILERRLAELGHEPNVEHIDPALLLEVADEVLGPVADAARIPRRAVERARRILAQQRRFTLPATKARSAVAFLESPDFEEALHLFRLRSAAWGQGWDVYEGWEERRLRHLELPSDERLLLRQRSRRRRRRRGGRRGGGGREFAAGEGAG